ncbi:hypothetical protein, partial [Endozoicomonas sp. ONNA2]|uniref:hypothetical protein n=1 Tax=Endozoicomonas sp. ONNA2 TaxID=2828741 RepID=UPI0021485DA7
RQPPDKTATATLYANHLPNTSLALGAMVGLSALGASSASGCDSTSGIRVDNPDILGKICTGDRRYPCHGTYYLTGKITADKNWKPIGDNNNGGKFTGQLCGNGTISKLDHCLVKHLADNGSIDGLHFKKARIAPATDTPDPVGVAACKMSGNARVSNIRVTNNSTINYKGNAGAGIVVGELEAGTVDSITAKNCNLTTIGKWASAGIGAGKVTGGTVINTNAINCQLKTEGEFANAGIGAGLSNNSVINGTYAKGCSVTTYGKYADAGIGVGESKNGKIENTSAQNCTVATHSNETHAGIGAGQSKNDSVTGTKALLCTVTTTGYKSRAAIGAGVSVNSMVTNTAAGYCNVTTTGKSSAAAIGVGFNKEGVVTDTTAGYCTVKASGPDAYAAIGQALGQKESVQNTRVINSNFSSSEIDVDDIRDREGGSLVACNVRINSKQLKPATSDKACNNLHDKFCKKMAPLVPRACRTIK